MSLKPVNILQAAERDLKLRNEKLAARPSAPMELRVCPYAFHRDDVRKADDVRSLLAAALSHPGIAALSGKPRTRMIYADEPLLRSALALCGGGAE